MSEVQVELIGLLKSRVSLKEKSFHSRCYAAQREVNLVGLDWIEQVNIVTFHIQVVEDEEAVHQNRGQHLIGKCPIIFTSHLLNAQFLGCFSNGNHALRVLS